MKDVMTCSTTGECARGIPSKLFHLPSSPPSHRCTPAHGDRNIFISRSLPFAPAGVSGHALARVLIMHVTPPSRRRCRWLASRCATVLSSFPLHPAKRHGPRKGLCTACMDRGARHVTTLLTRKAGQVWGRETVSQASNEDWSLLPVHVHSFSNFSWIERQG